MRVTRKKAADQPLSEFPGWGLEIMMGLYGEQQIRDAVTAEADTAGASAVARSTPDGSAKAESASPRDIVSSEAAEFDAVGSLFARVRRLRRH